jgi:flagellin-like protein
MTFTRKNDEAVSPVIGVILMVAIAVIAAFVFGMSGNINKTKIVAATVQQADATHMSITYQGGQDALTFAGANVTVTPGTAGTITYTPTVNSVGWLGTTVGSSCTVVASTTATFSGRDHVVVSAWFTDGGQQVILDTYV